MPTFSVTIPTYNEGEHLRVFALELAEAAPTSGPEGELVVVDDGSRPENQRIHAEAVDAAAKRLLARESTFTMRLEKAPTNLGKGGAIRLGWRAAKPWATWLGFLDADGAVPATEFWRLVDLVEALGDTFDVLAGSRIRMAGHRVERSFARHLQGRIFATLTEVTLGLGFYDTQCGVKLVRAELLRSHLDQLEENRWLLDVELLAVMKRAGARFYEEPIDWKDEGTSTVVPGVDAAKMFVGLRRLKARLARQR